MRREPNEPPDIEQNISCSRGRVETGLFGAIGTLLYRLALLLLAAGISIAVPHTAQAQGLEINGGWTYITGDMGTSGLNVGTAWWFTKRVTLAADYESSWKSSTIGTFTFTQVGATAVHSHLQSLFGGPRIFFSTNWTDRHKLNPFGEAEFGFSHLNQNVQQVNTPTQSASETDFTWLAGGGAEYLVASHWSVRANLDYMRTHFANAGQGRLRLVMGVAYTFGSRERKETKSTGGGAGPRY